MKEIIRMAQTKLTGRIFAMSLAVLFFVTSFGFTFIILWQVHQQNQAQKDQTAQTASAAKSATTPSNQSKGGNTNMNNSNKLEGKALAGFTPTASITSLQTEDTKVGTGKAATASSNVTVNYTGAVASTGTVFQSSLDSGQPVTFPLSGVIKGWSQGIPGMKVGGERRLLIPASLAYGANPPQGSGIPANADLVFDVTLLKIK